MCTHACIYLNSFIQQWHTSKRNKQVIAGCMQQEGWSWRFVSQASSLLAIIMPRSQIANTNNSVFLSFSHLMHGQLHQTRSSSEILVNMHTLPATSFSKKFFQEVGWRWSISQSVWNKITCVPRSQVASIKKMLMFLHYISWWPDTKSNTLRWSSPPLRYN